MRSTTTGELVAGTSSGHPTSLDVTVKQLVHTVKRVRKTLLTWVDSHRYLQALGLAAVTFLGLTPSLRLLDWILPTTDNWAIYWPFDGIIVAFLLMARRRHWPSILVGFLVASTWNEARWGEPLAEVATDVLCNFSEILMAAYALPAFRSLRQWMMEPRLVLRFALSAIFLGPLLSSLPVAYYFNRTFHNGYWHHLEKWGFADALGTALWTPLILILFSRETYDLFRPSNLLNTVALLGGLFGITWLTFLQGRYPISFLPYPFLLFVALRLGFSGAVLGANMLALIAAHLSLHGHGPFAATTQTWTEQQTIILQVYSTLAMLFVFPLSIMLIERRNFEEKLQLAYADMKQLATVDRLTGLANRRRFDEALEIEWQRALRYQTPISLLMIDADNFKAYNDRYGHVAGDECLRQIAAALSTERLRPHDLVARYGGEEFAILLPGVAAVNAEQIAQKMRIGIAAEAILHEGNPFGHVTISLGCASVIPGDDMVPEALISSADGALYAAKKSGRNRVHSADPA